MAGGETQTSESIWTRQINVPPVLARLGVGLYRLLYVIFGVLFLIILATTLWHRFTLGPGARLNLTNQVSIRVPPRFTAFEDRPSPADYFVKAYVVSGPDAEYGGLVAVDALKPGEPFVIYDPARMAAYASKRGEEVRGPVRFRYSGFDVVATVEPTMLRSKREGAYTLSALVDVQGQLVHIRGDNVSLGVSEQAGPQEMAEAAIDLLRLTAR